MSATGSVFKKVKSIASNGLAPYDAGKANFVANIEKVENTAKSRVQVCTNCPDNNYEQEPIESFRVSDDRIPQLSNKMCGDCGCSLPYLLRQNLKVCKHWTQQEL